MYIGTSVKPKLFLGAKAPLGLAHVRHSHSPSPQKSFKLQ